MSIMSDFEARQLAKESRLEAFKKYGKLYRTGTEVKVYSSVKSPFIQDKIILEKLSQRMIGNVYEVLNDSGFIVSLRVSNILFEGIGDYSDTTFPINRESVGATDKTQYSYPRNEK